MFVCSSQSCHRSACSHGELVTGFYKLIYLCALYSPPRRVFHYALLLLPPSEQSPQCVLPGLGLLLLHWDTQLWVLTAVFLAPQTLCYLSWTYIKVSKIVHRLPETCTRARTHTLQELCLLIPGPLSLS